MHARGESERRKFACSMPIAQDKTVNLARGAPRCGAVQRTVQRAVHVHEGGRSKALHQAGGPPPPLPLPCPSPFPTKQQRMATPKNAGGARDQHCERVREMSTQGVGNESSGALEWVGGAPKCSAALQRAPERTLARGRRPAKPPLAFGHTRRRLRWTPRLGEREGERVAGERVTTETVDKACGGAAHQDVWAREGGRRGCNSIM